MWWMVLDGPLYADFHALRHSYLTLGGRAGIDLRTLQELAGHSTPVLTARYSHRRLYDLAGAVEKLPRFLPVGGTDAESPRVRATGTDGPAVLASCLATSGGELGRPGGAGRLSAAAAVNTKALRFQRFPRKTRKNKALGVLHVWCWPWSSKPGEGLNKALCGFDSHTLPLLICSGTSQTQ